MTDDVLRPHEVAVLEAAQRSTRFDETVSVASPALDVGHRVSLPPCRRDVPLLTQRASSRRVTAPLSLEDVSDFLTAVLGTAERRGYARSGGLDHASFLVIASSVDGLSSGTYLVNAPDELAHVDLGNLQEAILMKVCTYVGLGWDTPPALTVLILSHWAVLASRYPNSTLHAGLLDSGVLLGTMQLAATSLGLPSTPCAAIAPFAISRALGLDGSDQLGHIATFLLGGPLHHIERES